MQSLQHIEAVEKKDEWNFFAKLGADILNFGPGGGE